MQHFVQLKTVNLNMIINMCIQLYYDIIYTYIRLFSEKIDLKGKHWKIHNQLELDMRRYLMGSNRQEMYSVNNRHVLNMIFCQCVWSEISLELPRHVNAFLIIERNTRLRLPALL